MSRLTPAQVQLEAFMAATCLVPAIVLDGVIAEVHHLLESDALADRLCDSLRSERTLNAIEAKTGHAFASTPAFKKSMSAIDPRPAYYAQMRIWVAAEIKCHFPSLYPKVPVPFRKGYP